MIIRSLLPLIVLAGLAPQAHAEKADRQQAVQLEADRVTVDDRQKLQVFEGNVILSQGTLRIQTAKMTVAQDNEGFQKGTALGGPDGVARFRQKREGSTEFIEGEAERIEHNGRSEKTEFFGRAHVKSGLDEVSGQHIVYDGKTQSYTVSGTLQGAAGSGSGRVKAVIQPKNKDATP